ncbi:type VI secretion system membrane subunit TssM [Vibrio parahaemolyticus]|nr:type VI secretion system membrane subunit TssM [Vibrio parahaemolyticus]
MWNMIKNISTRIRVGTLVAMPWLLLLSFVLINVAIWWLGPAFEWRDHRPFVELSHRLLASGTLLFIAAMGWGWSQHKALKKIENEKAKDEKAKQDPYLEIIEKQEAELDAVLEEMKSTVGLRNALYAQPWYLVMGEAQSGKSRFIERSGLSFLFSTVFNEVKIQQESTRSVDWWVGNEAVLIEPRGALITQHEASTDGKNLNGTARQWRKLVEWLEKTRRRRPLNGVVVTIDMAAFVTRDEGARHAYAVQIRSRLKELMETLSSRLPVYVVLTKFDSLYGFEPFFRYCSPTEREALFGLTYSLQSPERADDWLNEFSLDYEKMMKQLNALLLKYEGERTPQERQAMFSFVRQISGLESGIKGILETMFLRDKFSTPVQLRGTYFTSAEQQGVPQNIFEQAIALRYGLNHQVLPAQHVKQSMVYFVQSLFPKAVLPEVGLATDNIKAQKQKRRFMFHATLACGLATVLLLVGWQQSYVENRERAENVITKVHQFQESKNRDAHSYQSMLDSLEQIRSAMLAYGFFHEKPKYVSEMGLYQGHKIGPKIEQTYLNLLKRQFIPLLMNEVMTELGQAQNNEDKLAALRVYRMMTDQSGRQNALVMNHFAKIWHRQFTGDRETQEALLHHLQYALKHTDLVGERVKGDRLASNVLRPFDEKITKVQTALSQMPSEERVYRNLRSSAQSVLGSPLNIRQTVGPTFDVVFDTRVERDARLFIPKLLTKEGFERYFLPQMDSMSELALTDSWVLGHVQTTDFSDADKAALQDKIQALYIADYTRTWRDALNALDVQTFSNLDDAILVLDNIVSNTEPLQKLLRTLQTHTQLYGPMPDDTLAREALLKSTSFKMSTAIETPFVRLNQVLKAEDGEESNINQVLTSVAELDNYLKSIQEAPEPGMAALEATQARVGLKNADPIYTLKRISRGLPAPLDSLVNTLAQDSWYVVKQKAIQYLNVRWQTDVYDVFEAQFAHRYPFEPSAKKDVSLKDFEAFFAPGGTLDVFYEQQLKWFIDETTSTPNEANIVRNEILDELEQAQQIQQAFFNRKGVLDVNFVIEPVYLSNNKRRSILNVDGQFLSYSHGGKEHIEMIWPNTLREQAISKVTLMPNQNNVSPRSVSAQGPWALFHLLDKGKVTSASATTVDYQFKVDAGSVTYRLNSEANVNPFTHHLLSSFSLAHSLY